MTFVNKTRHQKVVWVVVICFFATILTPYIWLKNLENQYISFKDFETEHLFPMFDSLDYSVYSNLPLPENVKEIEKYASGGGGQHGRELVIRYEFSKVSLDYVVSFYSEYFSQHKWIKDYHYDDTDAISISYNKDTACLYFTSDKDTNTFWISIHHDYFSQSFSPKPDDMPPIWYIELVEVGEYYFERCPVQ